VGLSLSGWLTYDWLTPVVVKMNDQITITGDAKIKITLHPASNKYSASWTKAVVNVIGC
jgi:hypothetical protein